MAYREGAPEAALRAQITATEQMNAAEYRLTAFRVQSNQRELDLLSAAKRREAQIHDLETALTEAKAALSRATGQDLLVEQIVAKLAATRDAQAKAPRQKTGVEQGGRKKRAAA